MNSHGNAVNNDRSTRDWFAVHAGDQDRLGKQFARCDSIQLGLDPSTFGRVQVAFVSGDCGSRAVLDDQRARKNPRYQLSISKVAVQPP